MLTGFDSLKGINLPFLRAGIDPDEVQIAENEDDLEEFSKTIGTSYSGYGFTKGESIVIPDLPITPKKAGDPHLVVLMVPTRPGGDNKTLLVAVKRSHTNSKGKTVEVDSWLNARRLTERSFISREYVDDFRKDMATDYPNDIERIKALRGHKLVCTDKTKVLPQYEFDEKGDRKKLEDGTFAQQDVTYYVVEDKGIPKK